jgi:hypothetical protein
VPSQRQFIRQLPQKTQDPPSKTEDGAPPQGRAEARPYIIKAPQKSRFAADAGHAIIAGMATLTSRLSPYFPYFRAIST